MKKFTITLALPGIKETDVIKVIEGLKVFISNDAMVQVSLPVVGSIEIDKKTIDESNQIN